MNSLKHLCLGLFCILSSAIYSFAQTTDSIPANFNYGAIEEPSSLAHSSSTDREIYFPLRNGIFYTRLSQFRNDQSKQMYIKALELKDQQEAIDQRTANFRTSYIRTKAYDAKKIYADSITKLEQESFDLNKPIYEAKQSAYISERDYWSKASASEIEAFIALNEVKPQHITTVDDIDDAAIQLHVSANTAKATQSTETGNAEGLVYKVEVGRYKTLPWSVQQKFKKMAFIRHIDEQTNEDGVTIYSVGKLDNHDDAVQMQKQLESEGFSKPRIIAFEGDEEVNIDATGKKLEPTETIAE